MTNVAIQRLAIPITTTDHIRGPAEAPVTLLEYGDYECSTCGRSQPVIHRVIEAMGEKMRFVFRHFPLSSIHPHAGMAAQAAEAAGAQKRFWEMHGLLFEHQHDLEPKDFQHYALKIGLEPYKFAADMSSARFARRVAEHYEGGLKSNVIKTPTYFINDIRYEGPNEFESLLRELAASAAAT